MCVCVCVCVCDFRWYFSFYQRFIYLYFSSIWILQLAIKKDKINKKKTDKLFIQWFYFQKVSFK